LPGSQGDDSDHPATIAEGAVAARSGAKLGGRHEHAKPRPRFRARRQNSSFSRSLKIIALVSVIALAVVSSTLLDRADQIFLLKVFLVIFLSVFPGWLFLQFIRVKGPGLFDEYVLNLYRLKIDQVSNLPKPPPGSPYRDEWREALGSGSTDDDVARNIYLNKFEAAYGRGTVPDSRRRRDDSSGQPRSRARLSDRLTADAFSPVVLATAVFAVGWTVFVEPDLVRDLRIFVTLPLSGQLELPGEALRFGFLGSYVFIVQHLVRRYFQLDLRSQAYISAVARVILVLALVVAIHPLWNLTGANEEVELAFAFFLGFFPETGVRMLRQRLSSIVKTEKTPEERYPLSQLDGLTVWSQARLTEEGIEDMQTLTTANIVDLLLYTRMPIGRIVDWVDQGFLYLRVKEGKDRDKLRRIGIRSATDLLGVYHSSDRRDRTFFDSFLRILNTDQQGKDDDGPSQVEGLRRALEGEVNLWHVREWKRHTWLKDRRSSARPSTLIVPDVAAGNGDSDRIPVEGRRSDDADRQR
jgi:hypothetical protein